MINTNKLNLDVLEHVMGWKRCVGKELDYRWESPYGGWVEYRVSEGDSKIIFDEKTSDYSNYLSHDLFGFSKNADGMWMVLQRMESRGFDWFLSYDEIGFDRGDYLGEDYECAYCNPLTTDNTYFEDVCLTALKVLGIENEYSE